MKKIYCISGLGADERAFSKLSINGYELQVIPWLKPEKTETIAGYTARMRAGINEENPVLMGLSFGGMICTEIAKQVPVKQIIIISSIKTANELPRWMKTVASLKLNKILPLKSTRLTMPIQNRMLGVVSDEEKKLVATLRREAEQSYINWAVNEAINWKNTWQPPNLFHIHGDRDHMFPVKYVKADHIIKHGGHFMIMNRANEVSQSINRALQS